MSRGRSAVCGALVAALAGVACGGALGGAERPGEQLVLTLVPAGSTTDARVGRLMPAERYPAGSRVALVNLDGSATRVLSSGLAAAGGPDVAPTGDAVLFAGRRTESSRWAIYESRGGRAPRALIELDTDCIDPAYLAAERVVMACAVIDPTSPPAAASWALFTARRDGSDLERITFGIGSAFDPTPLQDGRILFALRGPAAGTRADLYTINPEGTLLEAFGDGHADAALRYRPRQDRSGRVLFVRAADGESPPQLLRADMNRPDAPVAASAVLAEREGFTPIAAEPSDNGMIVVSGGPGRGVLRIDSDGAVTELPVSVDGLWPVEALPLEASAAPRGRPRTIDTARETGLLIAYAAGRSDGTVGPPANSPVPHAVHFEAAAAGLSRGAAGVSGSGDAAVITDRTTVRPDGSFFVELPADRPVRVATVSAAGDVIATSAWFWVRPGEARACFGCHEGHAAAPVNRPLEAIAQPPLRVLPSLEPLIARLAPSATVGGAAQ